MRKYIFIILSLILFIAACGSNDEPKEANAEPERKESITNAETMEYLERLLEPYLKTSNLESEEEMFEVIEELDTAAIEIRRELKRNYEQDINAVDDLIALTELYNGLSEEVENDNIAFISAYGEDIGSQVGKIAIDYLDGDLPDNYAEVLGVSNIYDLE